MVFKKLLIELCNSLVDLALTQFALVQAAELDTGEPADKNIADAVNQRFHFVGKGFRQIPFAQRAGDPLAKSRSFVAEDIVVGPAGKI